VPARLARSPGAPGEIDLSHYGLDGLLRGEVATLYHGTTRSFKAFDISKSRTDLVDAYSGGGIFLTPSKRVAEQYADANRNIGFDPEIVDDLKRRNPAAGAFMESLYTRGDDAWDLVTPETLGVAPEDYADAFTRFTGGVDPNVIADVCRYVIGSKLKPHLGAEEPLNIFHMRTGLPDYMYGNLDELGLDSAMYRPKVYTVAVRVRRSLVTASKSMAKKARSAGYDSVVYYGPDLVGGVPEVAVFSPSDVQIRQVEVV
jgi:hypothetical protein